MHKSIAPSVAVLACMLAAPARAAAPAPHSYEIASAAAPTIVVDWAADTGTTHTAERLTVRARGNAAPLVIALPGDTLAKGLPLLPLVGRVTALTGDAFLVLGWSSTGGGMQTVHAWIVRAPIDVKPRVVDRLAWTTDRSHAGLAVDARGARVGIPFTFYGAMHDADDWSLSFGARTGKRALDIDAVKRLPFAAAPSPDAYAPPFGRPSWIGKPVTWIRATSAGFTL